MINVSLVFCSQPIKQGQPPDPLLKRCSQVLEALTRTVPGLLEALYLMAKVRFLQGMKSVVLSLELLKRSSFICFVLSVRRKIVNKEF